MDQLAKMTALFHADFASRMVAHLRDALPEAVEDLDDFNLRDRCLQWISQARDAGFQDEPDVELFLELCACYADIGGVPMAPWARAICGGDQTPASKLSALVEQTVFAPEAR